MGSTHRDIEALSDHLIKIVENKIGYIVKIEPIIYDDNGDAVNL